MSRRSSVEDLVLAHLAEDELDALEDAAAWRNTARTIACAAADRAYEDHRELERARAVNQGLRDENRALRVREAELARRIADRHVTT